MCGICGIVYADGRPVSTDVLVRMRDVQRHRGPDGAGLWQDAGVGLGHRRLAIIDLSSAGHQPMSNEDGTVWLTYNGEVYNFAELRASLLANGHAFRSRTDSEVLLHLYEEAGADLVQRLRGMFAFGVWDRAQRCLVLARDRLGVKPLYYTISPRGDLAFASEIKALLASGLVEGELNAPALSEYLANRYTTGSTTLYRNVHRLPPAHVAVWQDGRLAVRRYWEYPAAQAGTASGTDAELVQRFSEQLAESVRLRMISDAPIGVFLSGGLDSSAVTSLMAAATPAPLRTFSVGFAEADANELSYARAVAAAVGAQHQDVVVRPQDFWNAVPALVWHEDEPLAFPSSVPLYFVSRLAARSVKVVLTGEGSDELLAGYGKYWRTLYNLRMGGSYSRLPRALRAWVRTVVTNLPASRLATQVRRTFLGQPCDIESLFLGGFSVFDTAMQRRLLTPEFTRAVANGRGLDPYAGHRDELARLAGLEPLPQLLALDVVTYLHELLMKQDQMSMAASIESRVPFLDHRFVEFVATLPARLKLRGIRGKDVLRRAMRGRLPEVVLRRRKLGFPTPVGQWFRSREPGFLERLLLGRPASGRGMFRRDEVAALIAEHRGGRIDHTERLWSLVVTEVWLRTCLEGERLAEDWWR